MKKLVAVPVVAIIAAAGAASAAGFAGGVSAGPLQTGQTNDLECASSAKVIEWGYNDHLPTPNVVNARVRLTDADCGTQSLTVLPLNESGGQLNGSRAAGRIPPQATGDQTVRVTFNEPVNAEDLKSVRISIDPGFGGQKYGTIG